MAKTQITVRGKKQKRGNLVRFYVGGRGLVFTSRRRRLRR